MLMRLGYLKVEAGPGIPVRIVTREGATLLECREPAAFLEEVTGAPRGRALSPDVYLRGVFVHGEGAWLELFDGLGSLASDVLTLTEERAQALLRRIG